jgi:tRNA G18 (ribose-2'-O)-methylase SpoU
VFRLPFVRADLVASLNLLRERGLRLIATSSHKGLPVDQAKLTQPAALFIGNEGAGLDRSLISRMDELIAIPHSPHVESLNAAVATSIVLYEIVRQQRLLTTEIQSHRETRTI